MKNFSPNLEFNGKVLFDLSSAFLCAMITFVSLSMWELWTGLFFLFSEIYLWVMYSMHTTNYRWQIITNFIFSLLLKLLFYPTITTFHIEFIMKILWKCHFSFFVSVVIECSHKVCQIMLTFVFSIAYLFFTCFWEQISIKAIVVKIRIISWINFWFF